LPTRERYKSQFDAFEAAYRERIGKKEDSVTAFRTAAESALSELCDSEAITNVVFGIASDFETQSQVDVTRDAMVMPRLAVAYLTALEHLRSAPEFQLNLPFLTATSDGPLHFSQVVTIARLTELAQRPAQTAKPVAKSFWSRLFG
jgi:hypothetical protein